VEVLSQQRESFRGMASSLSHDDSLANTGDSDSENRSGLSNDTTSKSDSMKWVKVVTDPSFTEITFDFGISKVGRACVMAMEAHVWYFPNGYCRAPDVETILAP
jgi:hypothetical protein